LECLSARRVERRWPPRDTRAVRVDVWRVGWALRDHGARWPSWLIADPERFAGVVRGMLPILQPEPVEPEPPAAEIA